MIQLNNYFKYLMQEFEKNISLLSFDLQYTIYILCIPPSLIFFTDNHGVMSSEDKIGKS